MRSDLPAVARDIDVPERTLRRAVKQGTVRCHRPGPRQFEMTTDERAYLREHWKTISAVTEALRTERNVRLAALFGSAARGHIGEHSDVDVLVALAEERPMYLSYPALAVQPALHAQLRRRVALRGEQRGDRPTTRWTIAVGAEHSASQQARRP